MHELVGFAVASIVGPAEGEILGSKVGRAEGETLGLKVGRTEGVKVGERVGLLVVICADGREVPVKMVGASVGEFVGK